MSIVSLALLAQILVPVSAVAEPWDVLSRLTLQGTVSWGLLLLAALVPSLCANVYIVGLNQLTDIEIDRINKPDLPLASGAFSVPEGRWIVTLLGLAALGLSALQGQLLFATVALSLAIGTVYSLPPIRLKRFPFWAALCIFGVRGGVVNLGFFAHFRQQLQPNPGLWLSEMPAHIPSEIWALTAFVILFAFAIAIFKDIPDLEGDRQFQIRTLTVQLGGRFVFRLARWVLTLCYVSLIVFSLTDILAMQPAFVLLTHGGLLGLMWWKSQQVEFDQKQQVAQFYQFIWRLFFLEYLLFPLACALS